MNQIDPVYVIRLIDASKLLNDEQKAIMKAKLDSLSQTQLADLVISLEKEQRVLAKYYKNVGHIRKIATEKKVKAYYDLAESFIHKKEKAEIDEIESELNNL